MAKEKTKPETVSEETEPVDNPEVEETQEQPVEKTELELAEESIANLTDRLMRTAAEFDNFKKRSQREKEELYSVAVCDTVEKLLPVLDNLERAVAINPETADSTVLDGVKMIKKQFEDALTNLGVSPIDAVGAPFDPEKHNAVMTEESDKEENTVLEELMKGYLYKEKVIRHSMVKVSC